ncbi:MAG: hypothetical protein AAF690_30060 [Acidobacteriota bacterium]
MAAERKGRRKASKKKTATAKSSAKVSRPAPKSSTGRSSAPETESSWGRVDGYVLDDSGLTIKLNMSAISRRLVFVAIDRPMFKAAVSLVMMAHNNRWSGNTEIDLEGMYLSVQYLKERSAGDRPLVPIALASGRDVFGELAEYTVLPPPSSSQS